MRAQHVFDFLRRDVLAAADDDVLDAAGDPDAAVRVDRRLIAAPQPAIGRDRGIRWRRASCSSPSSPRIPCAHNSPSAPVATSAPVFGSTMRTSVSGMTRPTVCVRSIKIGIAGRLRQPGRRLGESVDDRQFRQVHLVDHPPHQRLRAQRAGHDPGPQRIQCGSDRTPDARARQGTSSARRRATCTVRDRRFRARVPDRRTSTGQRHAPCVYAASTPSTQPKQ